MAQAPPRAAPRQQVELALMLGIGVLALLFFYQTRNVFVLFGGIAVACLLFVVLRVAESRRQAAAPIIKARCARCRALNDEHATFCSGCSQPL